MFRRTVFIAFCFVIGALFVSNASAQVLATAETGGKGNQAVLVSVNGLLPEGLELLNVYGQYIYGVTDRFDAGPIYGNITVLGQTQHYVGLGWNLTLLRRSQMAVDVSLFGTVTVPLNSRNDASTVLATPALVVSRPLTLNGKVVSLYSGLNTNVPVGQRTDKRFTPPGAVWNVPVGISTAVSGNWLFFAEVDAKDRVNAVGIGLVRTF